MTTTYSITKTLYYNHCTYSCLIIFIPDAQVMCKYFEEVAVEIDSNKEEGTVLDVLRPVLDEVKVKFQKEASLGQGTIYVYADLVLFFTSKPCLAEVGTLWHSNLTDSTLYNANLFQHQKCPTVANAICF